MAEVTYLDSAYKFTNPVRKFKANDPYYWEVENIPIAQLEENILWLKDQLKQSESDALDISVNRADFNELKPYATGSDRVVRVKPGRYTARINDASTKTHLQNLTKVFGTALGEVDGWNASTLVSNSALETAIEKFKNAPNVADAMGMNGLVERSFVWSVRDEDTPNPNVLSTTNKQEYSSITGAGKAGPFLASQALLWAKSKDDAQSTYPIKNYEPFSSSVGFGKMPLTENHFIKYWQGVTRTAIVNVAEELTIQVPIFAEGDFSYTDAAGYDILVPSVQSRIDMVFIYSKPIDANSAKISEGGVVKTISKPTLGIVRGAGIGPSFKGLNINSEYGPVTAYDSDGNPRLLANPSDSKGLNMGFESLGGNDIATDVKGSFPAPDDLLNIAPLLAAELEENAIELVGQSILPVAYVFVNGVDNVDVEDVIDIRPFFRTTELAYNERAGLAAAMPQVSLANPVATKGLIDKEIKKVFDYATNLAGQDVGSKIQSGAMGYVFGGWHFGPEAVLLESELGSGTLLSAETTDKTLAKGKVRKAYGFPGVPTESGDGLTTLAPIPDFPDWDYANWANVQGVDNKGNYPHDYIDEFFPSNYVNKFQFTSLSSKVDNNGTATSQLSKTKFEASNIGRGNMYFVSKKIYFDRAENPWLADYNIDVSLVNCVPMTGGSNTDSFSTSHSGSDHTSHSTWSGVWVEKGWDHFTIYVGFQGRGPEESWSMSWQTTQFTPSDRTHIERFSTFLVPVESIIESDPNGGSYGFTGNPRMGLCVVPTIMWNMTVVPVSQLAHLHTSLGTQSTIKIKSI